MGQWQKLLDGKRERACALQKGTFPKTPSQKHAVLRDQSHAEEFHGNEFRLLVKSKVQITYYLKWKLGLQNVLYESITMLGNPLLTCEQESTAVSR